MISPFQESGDSDDEDLTEAYCEAKEKKPSGTEDAVDAFEFVLTLEQRDAQRTKWGFKALKQLLKLSVEKVSNKEKILVQHLIFRGAPKCCGITREFSLTTPQ